MLDRSGKVPVSLWWAVTWELPEKTGLSLKTPKFCTWRLRANCTPLTGYPLKGGLRGAPQWLSQHLIATCYRTGRTKPKGLLQSLGPQLTSAGSSVFQKLQFFLPWHCAVKETYMCYQEGQFHSSSIFMGHYVGWYNLGLSP